MRKPLMQFIRRITAGLVVVLACSGFSYAAVTDSTQALPVGFDGQYFEATSPYNLVAHVALNATPDGDTLQAMTIHNMRWDDPSASEPSEIVSASVRLWYVDADTGSLNTATAQYVGAFTYNGGYIDPAWSITGLSQAVGNNSGLYVTIDISASPTNETGCRFQVDASDMQFASGMYEPQSLLPTQPPRILITNLFPVTTLQANHTNSGQPILSTGQAFKPATLRLSNPDPDWPLTPQAPVFVSGITLTVRDAGGSIIAPNTALDQISIQDLDSAMFPALLTSLPATPDPVYIPLSISINAETLHRLEISAVVCSNPALAAAAFRLEITLPDQLGAKDAYSLAPVVVTPSGDAFPMQTSLFTIQHTAHQLDVYHASPLPSNQVVLKGQTGISPLRFTFINPGNPVNGARVDVTRITLAVADSGGVTLSPAAVFSRLALTSASGDVVFGQTTTIPSNGNSIQLSLTNSYCSITAAQPVTVCAVVDIAPNASATNFRLYLPNALAVSAQDSNSLVPVTVSNTYTGYAPIILDPFPMSSNVVQVATSLQMTGTSLAPGTLYPGERAALLRLTFTHPGPTDLGPLQITGITLTARDRSGAPVDMRTNLTTVYLVDHNGSPVAQGTPAAGSASIYFPFASLTLGPVSSFYLRVEVLVSDHPAGQSLTMGLQTNNAVNVIQQWDPARPVYVSGVFPMQSTVASLGGGEGELRLSNYPNPFAAGRAPTQIAYYLKNSATVTANLYTLAGDRVCSLCDSALQIPGQQVLTWNGRTASGAVVANGVYLLRIQVAYIGSSETVTQLRKLAVVK